MARLPFPPFLPPRHRRNVYTITKEFHFSASHQLQHLPPSHPCARLHGHNYVVVLELQAPALNPEGFVRDYGDLATARQWLDGVLDHRHLNEALGCPTGRSTTAEALARRMYDTFADWYPELRAVRVSETPKTWAEYRPAVCT